MRSYCRELASLPETGAKVFEAGDLLDDIGREFLEDPYGHIFLHHESHPKKVQPYTDEVLRSNPNLYHGFVFDLWRRGMLTSRRASWRSDRGDEGLVR